MGDDNIFWSRPFRPIFLGPFRPVLFFWARLVPSHFFGPVPSRPKMFGPVPSRSIFFLGRPVPSDFCDLITSVLSHFSDSSRPAPPGRDIGILLLVGFLFWNGKFFLGNGRILVW